MRRDYGTFWTSSFEKVDFSILLRYTYRLNSGAKDPGCKTKHMYINFNAEKWKIKGTNMNFKKEKKT